MTYTCPKDGGNLNVILNYEALKAKYSPDKFMDLPEASLWRYLNLLPVEIPADWEHPSGAPAGRPSTSPPAWPRNLACKSFGSRMKAPIPLPHSKTGPAQLSLPAPIRSVRK